MACNQKFRPVTFVYIRRAACAQISGVVAALPTVDQVAYAMVQANKDPDAQGNTPGVVGLGTTLANDAFIAYPNSLTHVYEVPFPLNQSKLEWQTDPTNEDGLTLTEVEQILLCSGENSPGRWRWNTSTYETAATSLVYRLAGLGDQAASTGLVTGSTSVSVGDLFSSYEYGGGDDDNIPVWGWLVRM